MCEYLSLFPEDTGMSLDRDIDMDKDSVVNGLSARTISAAKTKLQNELVGSFFH